MKFSDKTIYSQIPTKFHGAFNRWRKYHSKSLGEKFWCKVDRKSPDECWPFKGCIGKHGYGLFWVCSKGKQRLSVAHRIAWTAQHGAIPDGLYVLHKCDNRPCCNPKHLFLGTQQDNMTDCKNKHRNFIAKGEFSGSHKLTELQVVEIRNKYSTTRISHAQLALEYGVTKSAISAVIGGRHWKHLGNGIRGRIDTRRRKLSDDSVKMARLLYAKGETQKQIADKLAVSQTAVSAIVRRKTWKHVQAL